MPEGEGLTEGVKHDSDKDPWQLVPWDALRAITKVLAFGAKKYGDRNWERGMAWSRLHRATIEHMVAWFGGEHRDPETGFSHLWHAGCCILFLIAYEIRRVGTDDRPFEGNGLHPTAPEPPKYQWVGQWWPPAKEKTTPTPAPHGSMWWVNPQTGATERIPQDAPSVQPIPGWWV